MSQEPPLPVSLTEPLVTDPPRTIEADIVFRETTPAHRPAPMPSLLSGIDWTSPEILCVAATFVFMMLGGFGTSLGLPAELKFWLFLAAYLAGGWRGTIKGVRSLLGGTVDVDLLMVPPRPGPRTSTMPSRARCSSSSFPSRTPCRKWPSSEAAPPFLH